jgi:two-component system response regulator HydG
MQREWSRFNGGCFSERRFSVYDKENEGSVAMPTVMVVEDNDTMRLGISESLQREGYDVCAYDNGLAALERFKQKPTDLAVVDLKMMQIDGVETLKKIKAINPGTQVLMVSAYGTVDVAVNTIQLGAADFLTKPFSPEELRVRVKKIWQHCQNEKRLESLEEHNRLLNQELTFGYADIVGKSESIASVFKLIDQVAKKESTVLIQGESGTGKELIAHAIHRKSDRSENPFIKINCGALNENLLESELFGHEKGAFTGAVKQKKGRFELANEGTLFLDEIGDISSSMQIKLLRVLQEGEFERVGGEETLKCDVRIIAATNRDLQKRIADEHFRSDLYYRLSVIPIMLPPLRERKEDIPLLVSYFLNRLAEKFRQPVKQIDESGLELLVNYYWPGNIRELENLLERLYVIAPELHIETNLIAQHLTGTVIPSTNFEQLPLENAVFAFEKNLVVQAMKKADNVKNRAAKILGIRTSALYYKLEKFGLL